MALIPRVRRRSSPERRATPSRGTVAERSRDHEAARVTCRHELVNCSNDRDSTWPPPPSPPWSSPIIGGGSPAKLPLFRYYMGAPFSRRAASRGRIINARRARKSYCLVHRPTDRPTDRSITAVTEDRRRFQGPLLCSFASRFSARIDDSVSAGRHARAVFPEDRSRRVVCR